MFFLQPQKEEVKQYDALAREYGFGYEWMEPAFSQNLDRENFVQEMKDTYDISLGGSIHGVFVDINYSGGDPRILEISLFRMKQCIQAALSCGVHKIVFHTCFHPVLPPEDPLYDIWADTASEILGGLAEEYGVDLYIENVLDRTPAILKKMMQRINHKNIHVCLDVGHANLSPTPLEQWMDELAPYIRYIHLSDNQGMYDDHMAVGDGAVNFKLMQDKIIEHGIDADYTLEVGNREKICRSVDYLQRELPEVWKRGHR